MLVQRQHGVVFDTHHLVVLEERKSISGWGVGGLGVGGWGFGSGFRDGENQTKQDNVDRWRHEWPRV